MALTRHRLEFFRSTAAGGGRVVQTYEQRPAGLRQKRFSGRTTLVPDLDLSLFRASAVIDWISFRITTGRPTQMRFLQELAIDKGFRRPHVQRLVGDPGSANGTVWTVRLQAPEPSRLVSFERGLAARFPASRTELIEVEISVDFRPKQPSNDLRGRLVGVLRQTLTSDMIDWSNDRERPRYSLGCSATFLLPKGRPADGGLWLHERPRFKGVPIDATFYLGAKEGPWLIRIMDKQTDERDPNTGMARTLEDSDKRARVEVSVRESVLAGMGIFSLSDFMEFPTTRLQGQFFSFMLPTFKDTTVPPQSQGQAVQLYQDRFDLERFLASGMLGLEWRRRARRGVLRAVRLEHFGREEEPKQRGKERIAGLGKHSTDVAYEALNSMIQTALKALKQKMARSGGKV